MKKFVAAAFGLGILVLGVRELDAPRTRGASPAPPDPVAAAGAQATPPEPRFPSEPARTSARTSPPALLSTTPAPEARRDTARVFAGIAEGGTTLTWSPTAPFQGVRSPSDVDYGRLRELTRTALASERGEFRFMAAPEGAELGSVVWSTARGHEARVVAVPTDLARWSFSKPGVADERTPVRVRVTRAGQPAARVTVRHTLSFWEAGQSEEEKDARRVFLREFVSGDDGTFELVPAAGENALLASDGDERSLLWLGEPAGELVLELLPTVQVSGLVVADEPGFSFEGVRYHLGYFSAEDQSDLVWGGSSLGVRADGTFGPDRWPWLARSFAAARISGGEVIPHIETFDNGPASEPLELTLRAQRGHPFVLEVTTPGGEPLQGAAIRAYHWDGGAWGAGQQVLSDDQGRASVQVPAGELSLSVAKPGFTTENVAGPRVLAPQAVAPERIVLRAAGVLTGWVRTGIEPVRVFELMAWNRDQSYLRRQAFDDEEGAFRLDDVPRGETIFVTAFASRHAQSPLATVVLGDEAHELDLELPPGRRARGLVIDAVTKAPLTDAHVQRLVGGTDAFVDYRGELVPVNADGSFELDAVHPGRGGLAFFAEGHEELFFALREDDVEVLEVGLVAMSPLAVLALEVRDGAVQDFRGYRAWNEWNAAPTATELSLDGRLELVSRTGHFALQVARPDGVLARVVGEVRAGERLRVPLDFGAGVELAVTLPTPPPDVAAWTLRASAHGKHEDHATRAPWSRERAAFVLPRVTPGAVTLELRDAEGALAALRSVQLSDAPQQTIVLAPGGARARVRLVSARGAPWSTQPVTVGLEDASWSMRVETDSQGEFELGPLEHERVLLFAKLGGESVAYGIPVALLPLPATNVVTLDPGPRCLLRLHDGGAPLAGIHVHFTHAQAPRDLRFLYISDATGFVRGPFLGPGAFRVRVADRDYWPLDRALPAPADEPLALELFRRATLVLAVESAGQPVAGARFELQHVELGENAADWLADERLELPQGLVSDADGLLTLEGVPRGTYRWSCAAAEGALTRGELVLAGGGEQRVALRLAPR